MIKRITPVTVSNRLSLSHVTGYEDVDAIRTQANDVGKGHRDAERKGLTTRGLNMVVQVRLY